MKVKQRLNAAKRLMPVGSKTRRGELKRFVFIERQSYSTRRDMFECQFLKALIGPERIEHRIEAE